MRTAEVQRNTKETQIRVRLNLDGTGKAALKTGLPFLEHMLDQVARHGMVDLDIDATGDLHIDAHHTVEDTGLALGAAFRLALGDKLGLIVGTICAIPCFGFCHDLVDGTGSNFASPLCKPCVRPLFDISHWPSPPQPCWTACGSERAWRGRTYRQEAPSRS